MPSSTGPLLPPPGNHAVEVCGSIPAGLSGRMLGIGRDGVVHSIVAGPGQAASYQTQLLHTEPMTRNVLAFGGTILAFSDDSPAYELSAELDTFHVVDLAGQGRAVAPLPKHDPVTGDLHLVARADTGMQAHTVVTAGALTRRARPIENVAKRVTDLALTADRVVFVADGIVGIAPREGEARTSWIATGQAAPHLVQAQDVGETVVLLVLTPLLERWTLCTGIGTVGREVLDTTPRRFAHLRVDGTDDTRRFVWTAGDETICRHDLAESRNAHHSLAPHVPGDFVVVPDPARPHDTDGGWVVGFVHDPSSKTTDLRVIDAAHIAAPAVVTVRIPRPIPHDIRCTWVPST